MTTLTVLGSGSKGNAVALATDVNPVHLHALKALEPDRPYLRSAFCDITKAETFPPGPFDTVICNDVLAQVEDDVAALRNARAVLSPGGCAVMVLPWDVRLFGTVDRALGRLRRYEDGSLREVARHAGFEVKELVPFDRAGAALWWLDGRMLRRRKPSLPEIAALNALTPMLRSIDGMLPLPPLSMVAVLASQRP